MKILIIINEPFDNMALGRNTSLSYILSCVKLGHEVYIYNLIDSLPKNRDDSFLAFHLTRNKALCDALVKNYQELNEEIMLCVAAGNLEKLHNLKVRKVAEFLQEKNELNSLKLTEVEFVIQRLEPMKAPFPPAGEKDVNDILTQLRNLFPQLVFNCPINLSDKEIPLEINQILRDKIATPTAAFQLEDLDFTSALENMTQEYHKLYGKDAAKLVFKPKNSAQSLGVFAVKFIENGLDFSSLKTKKVEELRASQAYEIKIGLNPKELKKIIEILCFVQNTKTNKTLADITDAEILKTAKNLYQDEILVQPFLEGIKLGDIRTNFLKNDQGNFYTAGHTFRKSLHHEDKNFTTAYSTGGATSQPVTILAKEELENLLTKNAVILEILNGALKEKYIDVIELGADFILVGDGRNIFLGEINHLCQGLLPISEAMTKAVDADAFYEGGLGLTSRAVRDGIFMQKGGRVE